MERNTPVSRVPRVSRLRRWDMTRVIPGGVIVAASVYALTRVSAGQFWFAVAALTVGAWLLRQGVASDARYPWSWRLRNITGIAAGSLGAGATIAVTHLNYVQDGIGTLPDPVIWRAWLISLAALVITLIWGERDWRQTQRIIPPADGSSRERVIVEAAPLPPVTGVMRHIPVRIALIAAWIGFLILTAVTLDGIAAYAQEKEVLEAGEWSNDGLWVTLRNTAFRLALVLSPLWALLVPLPRATTPRWLIAAIFSPLVFLTGALVTEPVFDDAGRNQAYEFVKQRPDTTLWNAYPAPPNPDDIPIHWADLQQGNTTVTIPDLNSTMRITGAPDGWNTWTDVCILRADDEENGRFTFSDTFCSDEDTPIGKVYLWPATDGTWWDLPDDYPLLTVEVELA